jgi:hypothetical protein
MTLERGLPRGGQMVVIPGAVALGLLARAAA